MATLVSDNIDDLVIGALNNLGAPKFVNLLPELQHYEVMGRLLKGKKTIPGGIGYKRRIAYTGPSVAKMIGHHEVDTYTIGNHLAEFRVPWRYSTTHWAYGHQEVIENMGGGSPKALITDIVQPREVNAMTKLADLLEEKAFSTPATNTNVSDPWGFRYWLPSSQTTGFNGKNPTAADASSFSSKAGIDATTITQFANYTAAYTDVSKDDLLTKMRVGYRQIKWKSPVTSRDAREGSYDNYKIMCDGDVYDKLERIGEGQNENLGKDLAPFKGVNVNGDGDILFRKHPICWVPQEDSANGGDGSVWMINTNDCFIVTCKGNEMRRTGPHPIPNMHNDKAIHVDLTWNMVMENCRGSARFVPTT